MSEDFNELLAALRNPGDDGPPDSIYDDLAGTYNHAVETRDAKISEQTAAFMDRESEISRLKSANYDLMMQSSSASGGDDDNPTDDGEDDDAGVDSLFDS